MERLLNKQKGKENTETDDSWLNDLKKRLMDHALDLADEPLKNECPWKFGNGDADIWCYAVESVPGGAYHDESIWDDAGVSISLNEYRIDWHFTPMDLDEKDAKLYSKLFAGLTYSLFAYIKKDFKDPWDYSIVTKVVAKIENPNNATQQIWVEITHDYGRC